jgi:hypothetical protein
MRMLWDLHKARAHKRKQEWRLYREYKMKDFLINMELAHKHYKTYNKINEDTFWKNVYSMPAKYAVWVSGKIHYDTDKTPLSEEHMAMDEICRLMLLWRKTSTKKIFCQKEVKRLTLQERAIEALFRHKMRKYKI